jgi:hypothetical protein
MYYYFDVKFTVSEELCYFLKSLIEYQASVRVYAHMYLTFLSVLTEQFELSTRTNYWVKNSAAAIQKCRNLKLYAVASLNLHS